MHHDLQGVIRSKEFDGCDGKPNCLIRSLSNPRPHPLTLTSHPLRPITLTPLLPPTLSGMPFYAHTPCHVRIASRIHSRTHCLAGLSPILQQQHLSCGASYIT